MPDDIKEEKTGFAKVDSAAKTTGESRLEPLEPKTFKAADEPVKADKKPITAESDYENRTFADKTKQQDERTGDEEKAQRDERTDEERAQQAEVDALNPLKADAYKTDLQRDLDAQNARAAGEKNENEDRKDGEEGEVNRSPASAQDIPVVSEPLNKTAAVAVDLGIPVHQANSMTAPGSNN